MNEYWQLQLSKVIDYLTRKKRPGFILIGSGAALLAGQKALNFAITGDFSWGTLSVGTADSNFILDYMVPVLALVLIASGLVLTFISEIQTFKQNSRKRIILITGDGLRTTSGTGLATVVKSILKGIIHPVEIDITQQIRNGVIIEPKRTFERQILPAKDNIVQLLTKNEKDMTQIAYGGFLPVPFTFLLGNIVDDKGEVNVFDWDRKNDCWRIISTDKSDDGEGFISEKINEINSDEIVLMISCSYKINYTQVKVCFPGMGIEHLMLKDNTFDNHWSINKQRRLSMQFAEKVKTLSAQGIRTVHLILAAQSSMVLNFGRRYDSRNMPEIIIYQYEQTSDNPYPWGIYGLTHGREDSGFVSHDLRIKTIGSI
ncbi:SAVED domain-containing protein [Pantoea ananatis]|uniref:SAVED domain-containing protein n=1 Tax=Pantoea ananas TaxID=553 RepID=UPI001F4E50A4|nr:SAVED domain-containing protein [Pantoea ananatis]MCH9269910.1 SAVED domain-containing protein [Pantoea ananatis]